MKLDEALNTLKENGFLVENEITDAIQNNFNNNVNRIREIREENPKRYSKKARSDEEIANTALDWTNKWVKGVIESAVDDYLAGRDYDRIDWDMKLSDFFSQKTINDYENPEVDWTIK